MKGTVGFAVAPGSYVFLLNVHYNKYKSAFDSIKNTSFSQVEAELSLVTCPKLSKG